MPYAIMRFEKRKGGPASASAAHAADAGKFAEVELSCPD